MTEQAISALRRRMIEDMSIRKFAAKTQHDYVRRVKDFATFLVTGAKLVAGSTWSWPACLPGHLDNRPAMPS
jgi:hypothetical protein